MKVLIWISLLLLILLPAFQTRAQKLTQPEIDTLNWKIYDFLQEKVEAATSVESELILVVLQTDSTSNFSCIRLLADDKNRDRVYKALSQLRVSDFDGWKPADLKNMSIVIPVYGSSYYPKKKNNYADMIFGDITYAGDNAKIRQQDKTSVLLSGILWMPNGKGHGDETKKANQ